MKPLSGLGILITRPAHQAGGLIDRLHQAGAHAISLPVIEIEPLQPADTIAEQHRLNAYDLMIFISANAVIYGEKIFQLAIKKPQIAAIGQATARILSEHGIKVDLHPESGFTSETLLALPDLQTGNISGKNILIVRGEGGREHLADTLKSRGASVAYAEVYRRKRPDNDVNWLVPLWQNQHIHLVTVTSNEALENLYHMLKNQHQWLLQTPVIVPGERCHHLATELGFNSILTAHSASDDDMVQAIINWKHKSAPK